ncbi:Panacea domain-containing protein [Xylocopilactobacillus apis]|uniref:Antitoxin SocA-like Panacea domain-containing protein n=1 Tax=Xylocopilactobacillus apis TaxID=2932183 RepID=A0AAU9D0G5_9LACO|nr:type II toxin-antitoxin system antitoxin SocA domain-containing protein [Xylocopilactobacillus apis]BDR55775.1 hypothetical protein KIMC2_03370 [Xylocopilactobacillus apis]
MGMNELAEHIFAVAKDHNLGVTNLQLQKVMYFCIRDYLKEHPDFENDSFINNLYDDRFETWDYGPVVPSIYRKYSGYSSMPIPNKGINDPELECFDESIVKYLWKKVFDLVKISHQQPLWRENREKILNHTETFRYKLNDIAAS